MQANSKQKSISQNTCSCKQNTRKYIDPKFKLLVLKMKNYMMPSATQKSIGIVVMIENRVRGGAVWQCAPFTIAN